MKIFLGLALFVASHATPFHNAVLAQDSLKPKNAITILDSGRQVSLRGLSVVSDQVIWASGSNGMVARSTNGGEHFEWTQVPGYEQRDFRDIEAFSAKTALLMAIAAPAVILRTTDGGKTWKPVLTDSTPGMFLDAMYFDGANGTVVGDPVNGKIYLANTSDSGKTWTKQTEQLPDTDEGEAFFASSGTNLHSLRNNRYAMALVTGGKRARLLLLPHHRQETTVARPLPLLKQGAESTGANSIAIAGLQAVITGGDFMHPQDTTGNCIFTENGGDHWKKPAIPPNGYRSCVIYYDFRRLLTCGLNGVDISIDGGQHWQPVSKEGFHVAQKSRSGKMVFLAGGRGKIARWMP
ncbi:oxidoreductase [Filimonas effusa]|uniref:Oxidoreductase n=1 Tax=Filimonas effusa TaxID=2508721 RepID=A0A4Q1DFJ5_9BACT|nr:oxidoreductase [Filimonas effusa]